ncbi:hypothetical protein K504DRAFT_236545 [Pleomassaria siparia CBS 279.74]|uniref:Uncharacterized protein n=1 Tax=Pleomassaria siparia CBS 279.74 TaxID=1314801 RepID=A0A6G1KD66_9PLEO|nr:hypothetical protein K504DRAFT_236545 [Pleomassaria siparia CBS 279.74]
MEPVREAPWAEHEKVYLLAEILKASPIPSHVLFNLIRDANIQPRWNDIALPHGRSVRSSQIAFGDLNATYSTPDYRQQRPQLPAPIAYPGPDISKKRPLQPEITTPIGRLLQPRPPHSYPGEFVSGPAYIHSPTGEPANKKKRGRPTKAEAQARADAAAARGEVYPPPRKARTSMTTTEPPLGEARMHGDTPPGPTPIAHMASSSTPQMAPMERGSESSSGKKKRSKPTPLELEKSYRAPRDNESPLQFSGDPRDPNRSHAYSTYTPISGPLPASAEPRDRDIRMEGVEEVQPRTTTPHSFKDTVGI